MPLHENLAAKPAICLRPPASTPVYNRKNGSSQNAPLFLFILNWTGTEEGGSNLQQQKGVGLFVIAAVNILWWSFNTLCVKKVGRC